MEMKAYLGLYARGDASSKVMLLAKDLDKMAERGRRALTMLSRSSSAMAASLDTLSNRYTALGSGAASIGTMRMVANFDTEMTKLRIASGASAEQMVAFRDRMLEVARMDHIRLEPAQILSAISEIVERTGDFDYAKANMENLGVAMRATFGQGLDIGGLAAEMKKLGPAADDLGGSLAILAAQGDVGAFTLKKLSTQGAPMISAYATMGRVGKGAVREVGAMAQVAMVTTAQADTAKTAVVALINELQNAEKQAKLKGNGIQLFDPDALAQGKKVYRAVPEIVKDIIVKAKGDATKIGGVFGDEAMNALKIAITDYNNTGGFGESIDKFMNVKADTAKVIADAKTATQAAGVALSTFSTAWENYANKRFAEPIKELALWINSIQPEKLERVMDIGTAAAGALGAAMVGRKVVQGGKGVARLFGKGEDGSASPANGLPAGASLAATAVPVQVVNWPAGGAGLSGGDKGFADTVRDALGDTDNGNNEPTGRRRRGQGARGLRGLASRAGRWLGRAGGGIGGVLGAVDVAGSMMDGDTRGALAGAGRTIGGIGGGALGSLLGPAGMIGGGAAGAWGGEKLFTALYDYFAKQEEPQEIKGGMTVEIATAPGVTARVTSLSSQTPGFELDVGRMSGP